MLVLKRLAVRTLLTWLALVALSYCSVRLLYEMDMRIIGRPILVDVPYTITLLATVTCFWACWTSIHGKSISPIDSGMWVAYPFFGMHINLLLAGFIEDRWTPVIRGRYGLETYFTLLIIHTVAYWQLERAVLIALDSDIGPKS